MKSRVIKKAKVDNNVCLTVIHKLVRVKLKDFAYKKLLNLYEVTSQKTPFGKHQMAVCNEKQCKMYHSGKTMTETDKSPITCNIIRF